MTRDGKLLKPYPIYKDSGVRWLGNIPAHWQALPNRALFVEVNDRNHPEESLLSVTIGKGIIQQADLLISTSKKDSSNENKTNYKLVQPGDIAYNKMRAWQGAVGRSNYQGIVSPAYIVVRPRGEHNPDYFHYLLRTPGFAKEAERWSYGITSDQWSLRAEDFKQIYCSLPPQEEQEHIVDFLTHIDLRVNRFIRANRRVIALLNEQKQLIIHRAITRGLDSDVRLKASGVEWLGEVPEHWAVVLFGRCLRHIEQGWSPVAAEGEISPNQWAVLTLSSVKRGIFNAAAIKPIPASANVPSGIEVKDGDLLLTRSNTRELVGDVCIVQGARPKTVICDLIYRLIVDSRVFEHFFLVYQLLSPLGRQQIERDARGSSGTMPKITQRHIKSWRVVVPPLDEQHRIVEFLDTELQEINQTIERVEHELDLIREYRTRLITDVVTGKIDVRGVDLSANGMELSQLVGLDEVFIDEELEDDEALEPIEENIDATN